MEAYKKVSLILAVITGFFIFYISSLSFPPTIPGFSYTSLIYHFSIFFLFSLFLLISGKFSRNFIFLILALSFVYAGLDEMHQFFVPGRNPDFFDLGIDFAGSFASFLILAFGFRLRNS